MKYFDLTNDSNDISVLNIRERDRFECDLVDDDGNVYKGFLLAKSAKGNVLTLCDIGFHVSGVDQKYQPRLVFRKVNRNFKIETVSENREWVRIPFDKGYAGYREFWKMIAFLYGFKDIIDLGQFDESYTVVDKDWGNIISQLTKKQNKSVILNNFSKIAQVDLEKIHVMVNLTRIKNVLDEWKKNIENADEKYWHTIFQKNSWILSQIFACPYILIGNKFYCGGKEDDNKGGVEGDFLYKNEFTSNLAFIEIKNPSAQIIGSKYRGKKEEKENVIYSMSNEITGGVNQVLNQKKTYLKEHREKNDKNLDNVKCILIIGEIPREKDKRRSLELYRNSMRDVEIITFDELFRKLANLYHIFNRDIDT
ncbi:DUF4263 domain-containing protein [bacterium]|nr:DUF4263 domain-containing protein [bacterium]